MPLVLSKKDYIDVVNEVLNCLKKNPEWKKRYKEYLDALLRYKMEIEEAYKSVTGTRGLDLEPLKIYMNLSSALQKNYKFDLRYHGQSVADIVIDAHNVSHITPRYSLKSIKYNRIPDFEKYLSNKFLGGASVGAYMTSHRALPKVNFTVVKEDFINFFQAKEREILKHKYSLNVTPEHELESDVLANFAMKTSDCKMFPGIQPIIMGDNAPKRKTSGCMFQMPTPICASQIFSGLTNLKYSRQYGGGIDILTRLTGKSLGIIELKDQYHDDPRGTKPNESPAYVIKQAIAYTVFLQQLLRDDSRWFGFFGYSKPRNTMTFKAIVCIRYKHSQLKKLNKDFNKDGSDNLILKIGDSNDKIELNYLYIPEKRDDKVFKSW